MISAVREEKEKGKASGQAGEREREMRGLAHAVHEAYLVVKHQISPAVLMLGPAGFWGPFPP